MSRFVKRLALLSMALLFIAQGTASAQIVGVRGFRHPFVYSRFYYDPFWGPYPYGYWYPHGVRTAQADVRVQVTPKQTEVFVDGFYAGVADDFDGVFKRLHTTPGGHVITLYLDGPNDTYKLHDSMERLATGETSAPPPSPSRPLTRPSTSVAPPAPLG
jgi:hypothetical protein